MTETVYAVFKQGVYRHECGGVFSAPELAIGHADRLAATDEDDYHAYEVVPFVLNALLAHAGAWMARTTIDEPDVIYRARKPTPASPRTEEEVARAISEVEAVARGWLHD